MPFIILGVGIGCWMYAFVNHRWNDDPWIGSTPFVYLGLAAAISAVILFFL